MSSRIRCYCVLAILAVVVGCMPPRPGTSLDQGFRRHRGGTSGCRWVVSATDPDIRRWWLDFPRDIGGHDRDGREVCR